MTGKHDYYTACAIIASIRWQMWTIITLYLRLLPPLGDRYVRSLHCMCDYCLHWVTGMYDYYTVCAITASFRWQVRTIITLYVRLLPPFGDSYVRSLHCMWDYCVHSVTGMYDYYTVCAITASFRWQVSTIITLHVRLLPPFGDRNVRWLHCMCDCCLHSVTDMYDYYTASVITSSIRWQVCAIITLYLRSLHPFGDRHVRLLHCICNYCFHSLTGMYDYYTVCAITPSFWWQVSAISTLYVRLLPPFGHSTLQTWLMIHVLTTLKPAVISAYFYLHIRLCIVYICDVYLVYVVFFMYAFSSLWRFGNKQNKS